MSTKCIICYTDLPRGEVSLKKSRDISLPEEVPGTELLGQVGEKNVDLLSKHLDVIFILRNILEVPVDQLSFFLRHCPSIENWITTCVKCEELIQNSRGIYRKWQEAKSGLIKIVKETYNKEDNDAGMRIVGALDITDKCRQFISEGNYKLTSTSFIEGDLRARELLKCEDKANQENLEETIEVKEELPELIHLPENDLEYLTESLLDIPLPIKNDPSSSPHPYQDDGDNDHWNEGVEMTEKEDFTQHQPDEVVLFPTIQVPEPAPVPPLPLILTKPTRKNMPRVAKRVAKTKTQNLLRKLDKPLFPVRKLVRSPKKPTKKKKGGKKWSHKKLSGKEPVPQPEPKKKGKIGRPKKHFVEEPVPEPADQDIDITTTTGLTLPLDDDEIVIEIEPGPPPKKFVYRDYAEELNEINSDIPINEDKYDDDFEISDIEAAGAEDSSDFDLSEEDDKPKKKKKRNSSAPNPRWRLKCPEAECPLEFNRRHELNAHLLKVHDKVPQPPVIGKTRKYPDECYDYSENRKRQYHPKIPSKCDLCLKTFTCQGGLRAHMRLMDKLRWPHHCKICGKGETSKESLDKHEALCQTGEALLTLVTCPAEDCGLILNSTVLLETHYRHHHREMEQQPCTMANCPENFYTGSGLEFHLQDKHKKDKPFPCDHCSQSFESKTKMREHKKRALEREMIEKEPSLMKICNYCGKTFVTICGLRRHVDMAHEKKVIYPCEHCGKGNSSGDRRNIHMWKVHRRRDVVLKWRCEVEGCGRICTNARQFRAHKARHEGTPQFCCEECGKEFYEEHHLREHVSAMHESKKGEKVRCDICDMEFGYWKYMERHKRTVHGNKKRRPKNKPKETEEERKDEQKMEVGEGGMGKEQVFVAAGQEFNLQIA